MIHIRVDHSGSNAECKFACGIGPNLPQGDVYYFDGEAMAGQSDCPGCNPNGPKRLGTPISALSGRPGWPGYTEFCEIARSWGRE